MKPLNIVFLLLVIVAGVLGYFLFKSINIAPIATPAPSGIRADSQTQDSSTPLPNQNPSEIFSLGIPLLEQNNSDQMGGVSLVEDEGKVTVTINIESDSTVPQPAHIHKGSCSNPGEVVYPLEPVFNGTSTTTIDATIEDLVASPMAVNVHKSSDEANVYVACGDIVIP